MSSTSKSSKANRKLGGVQQGNKPRLAVLSARLSEPTYHECHRQLRPNAEPNESPRLFCRQPAVAEWPLSNQQPLCPVSRPVGHPLLRDDRALTVPPPLPPVGCAPRALLIAPADRPQWPRTWAATSWSGWWSC